MASPVAVKRLTREYMAIQASPTAYLTAKPLENNILEWHYVIDGPPDTPYHGGEYYGRLVFPAEYPFRPPAIYMTTPNGRFKTNTSLCLTMSEFHPNTWNPAWSVSTIINGLLSFMCGEEPTSGSINTSTAQRKAYALNSRTYNRILPKFKQVFPELCDDEHEEQARASRALLKDAEVLPSSSLGLANATPFHPWKFLLGLILLCFLASRFTT